ncbi:uncharacterized protein E0L32_000828 [Thyridium curvatum]|uniref:Laccase n=1 Tax=Thyridium curvatum TaxID=1093900 RepID=A0A507B6J4_9PEZI|nr:uncharacterized protein E0L32_000828 [Thyridium curvatum]TPX12651.1 hypothetical protein E0L32_000828 [Thyridium curvatum]
MKSTLVSTLTLVTGAIALSIPSTSTGLSLPFVKPRQSCQNTPTSRQCWGEYSIDTNWYDKAPDTGVTREYWLSVERGSCAPDGYQRTCMTFNGTVPGPAITANWGDNLVIHVTNNIPDNGTSIHWHGMRQVGSVEYDGVPGVTQCPISPGKSLTYKFRATQYGGSWYHSHFTLQYAEGLFGPMNIYGPATANYDEDLGSVFLQDWPHTEAFALWYKARQGGPPVMENGLINGTNTFNCTGSADKKCVGGGKKFEVNFEAGKKYRMSVVNVATDGHFQFSIDGHSLTVISTDLVPIVPYKTDSVLVSIGQRYDVVVEANAKPGNYWLRAGWNSACANNGNAPDITGIVRYDKADKANPTSNSTVIPSKSCGDEPLQSLVPHVPLDVTNIPIISKELLGFKFTDYFRWTINTSSLVLDWKAPTLLKIFNNETIFPTEYNVVAVNWTQRTTKNPEWAVLVIQDQSGLGIAHPIHLHGHDFWVLAQTTGIFDGNPASFNTKNPPRRDTATLPGNGYLALAFQLDNPGAWLVHCHIAWHASEGLSLEFVEDQRDIAVTMHDTNIFMDQCRTWKNYTAVEVYHQDDSGI